MFRKENKYQYEVVRTATNHIVKLTNVKKQTKNAPNIKTCTETSES